MNTVVVYQVVAGDAVRYSCLSYDEAKDYGTAYYGEDGKDYFIEEYDHQPVDHSKEKR